jgi:hypothetical protein
LLNLVLYRVDPLNFELMRRAFSKIVFARFATLKFALERSASERSLPLL